MNKVSLVIVLLSIMIGCKFVGYKEMQGMYSPYFDESKPLKSNIEYKDESCMCSKKQWSDCNNKKNQCCVFVNAPRDHNGFCKTYCSKSCTNNIH